MSQTKDDCDLKTRGGPGMEQRGGPERCFGGKPAGFDDGVDAGTQGAL